MPAAKTMPETWPTENSRRRWARDQAVQSDRPEDVARRLRSLRQRAARHETVRDTPSHERRPMTHHSPVPEDQRAADEEDEDRLGLRHAARLEDLAKGGIGRRRRQGPRPRQIGAAVAVENEHDEESGQHRRQPGREGVALAEADKAKGNEPVLQRRPAQERLALLARHDPVAALDHLRRDLCPPRFFAAQVHVRCAIEVATEHDEQKKQHFPLAPPGGRGARGSEWSRRGGHQTPSLRWIRSRAEGTESISCVRVLVLLDLSLWDQGDLTTAPPRRICRTHPRAQS